MNEECSCTVNGCGSGLFIARNKEGSPLPSPVVDDIDQNPYTGSFTASSTGKVRTTAVCFSPLKVKSSEIEIE